VQPRGRTAEVELLGDDDEVAQMAKLGHPPKTMASAYTEFV
jgi:hypothetical protein